jgi:hypothetical protein
MGLKLVATSGGSIELVPTNTASNFTATMPAGTGTVAVNGVSTNIVSGTAVASTSGTNIDFTSIPSWVKRITVMFKSVSTNSTSLIQVQLGAGSVTTSGYNSTASFGGTSGSPAQYLAATTGFIASPYSTAALTISGMYVFTLLGSDTWTGSGNLGGDTSGLITSACSGGVTLGGTLDRVRITTVNGTDTFDAGSINILYE